MSTDRVEWRDDATMWGRDKYGCTSNPPDVQQARLDTLRAIAQRDKLDGRSVNLPSFSHLLQAVARLKKEKSAKAGGTVAEMYQSLPYLAVCHLYQCLCKHFLSLGAESPKKWKLVELSGIPKSRITKVWKDFRLSSNPKPCRTSTRGGCFLS